MLIHACIHEFYSILLCTAFAVTTIVSQNNFASRFRRYDALLQKNLHCVENIDFMSPDYVFHLVSPAMTYNCQHKVHFLYRCCPYILPRVGPQLGPASGRNLFEKRLFLKAGSDF